MQKWLASLGRHKALKLLSLLLALALWFAVSGEERTETSLHMALEFVNLPAKMVITSEVPAELQVRVIGPALHCQQAVPNPPDPDHRPGRL